MRATYRPLAKIIAAWRKCARLGAVMLLRVKSPVFCVRHRISSMSLPSKLKSKSGSLNSRRAEDLLLVYISLLQVICAPSKFRLIIFCHSSTFQVHSDPINEILIFFCTSSNPVSTNKLLTLLLCMLLHLNVFVTHYLYSITLIQIWKFPTGFVEKMLFYITSRIFMGI